MTRIDDKILLRRYHEDGDLQAREQLIEQYMSLVRSLARRYSYRGEQLEDLDDLQTALDALLGCRDDAAEMNVRFDMHDDSVRSTVGPFAEAQLDELESDSNDIGLRRVLETVTDGFEVERRDGDAWVVFTKHTNATAEAAG